jgi:hypothetical protein
LPLAFEASSLGRIATVTDSLAKLLQKAPRWSAALSTREVSCAAARAGRIIARFGRLDSCLTRSLVCATLVADRSRMYLNIGFRWDAGTVVGHAWLSIDGKNISDVAPQSISSEYRVLRAIRVSDYAPSRSFTTDEPLDDARP